MTLVSSIQAKKPSGLTEAFDTQLEDVIIREQQNDSVVVKQTVAAFLAGGPFAAFSAVCSQSAQEIAASSNAVIELSAANTFGLYAESDWFPGVDPEKIVMPASGSYLALVFVEVANGEVSGEILVELLTDPVGTPTSVGSATFLSGGMSKNTGTCFFRDISLSEGDSLGIKITNNGLSAINVDDGKTRVFVLKIA